MMIGLLEPSLVGATISLHLDESKRFEPGMACVCNRSSCGAKERSSEVLRLACTQKML